MIITDKYTLFYNGPFSQWYPSQFRVMDDNMSQLLFAHAEQYMMYRKAMLFHDTNTAKQIMLTSSPNKCKTLGRQVLGYDDNIWKLKARNVVYHGNLQKFTQNPDLKQQLIDTAPTLLVEASPTDTIWGIGWAETNPEALDQAQWRGLNWLGEVLTQVRDYIIGVL